jgi:2-polyprenyl-3-methyl-5-hydroxy-6-metoxy-1,4-benzoquinol methylase
MAPSPDGLSPKRTKPPSYFDGARNDFVEALPQSETAAILELGCANGGTGALALASGKCGRYVGIEISESAAEIARLRLTQVIVGDVEKMALPWDNETFDVLIMSEVLEHLSDPWRVVRRLVNLVRPGGIVMASSPNVSHYRVILGLLSGKWELQDSGVMDRTHLRWFTPNSFREMFEMSGVRVQRLEPIARLGGKARAFDVLTAGRLKHLLMVQINMIGVRDETRRGIGGVSPHPAEGRR